METTKYHSTESKFYVFFYFFISNLKSLSPQKKVLQIDPSSMSLIKAWQAAPFI